MEGVKRYAPLLSLSFAIQIKFVTPPRARAITMAKHDLPCHCPIVGCRSAAICFQLLTLCAFFFVLLLLLCSAAHGKSCERERVREWKSSQTQTAERKAFNTRCAVSFSKPNANKQMFVFLYVQRQQSTAERESAWESAQQLWSSLTRALQRLLSRFCSLSQLSQFPPTHCQNALTYCAPFKLSAKWAPLSCYDNADNEPVWQPQLRIFLYKYVMLCTCSKAAEIIWF